MLLFSLYRIPQRLSPCLRLSVVAGVCLQDERYSYVVITKEPRPELSSPLSISRHRQDAAELESATPYVPKPQSWRKSESKMRQAAALQKILDGKFVCARPLLFTCQVFGGAHSIFLY